MGVLKQSLLGVALLAPGAAGAQAIVLKPIVDTRLRYEHIDQDGIDRAADATTARVRAGVIAARGDWSALVESEATLALDDRYFDGVNGPRDRPTVGDPQNIELNRAQLAYTLPERGSITLGRQRIDLADQRFVASAPFRQNEQTFDAVRIQATPLAGITADVTYAWSVRTGAGINGAGARPQAIGGDQVFALLGWQSPLGTLTGFAYLVDADEAALQGYRLSSQSYGARLAGKRALGRDWSLGYAASVATQRDYARNPNRYRATYRSAEATLARRKVGATLGYEVLGADRGAALTSFQTPLAALFRFQGWASRFATTPPDGVRDLYVGGNATVAASPRFGGVTLTATWHRFDSDRLVRHYGDELDLLAAARFGRTLLSLRYADYTARTFATDTRKLWLTAEWVL